MSAGATIVWFRRDLRLTDQPALQAAVERGAPIIPVFIWAPEEESPWAPGAASRWWLHHSLIALDRALLSLGSRLILRRGPSLNTLRDLLKETGATAVYWNRLYEPVPLGRDKLIKAALRDRGVEARSFNSALLHEPWTVQTQQAKPYQVFTPFYRACQIVGDPSTPQPAPRTIGPPASAPSMAVSDFKLLPAIPWYRGMEQVWEPGERGALKRLARFEGKALAYLADRDRPAIEGTSRLSPHLHWGEVGPRQVWWAIRKANPGGAAEPYLRQLMWREFAHHLLFHFPHTPTQPLRPEFAAFPWAENPAHLRAWQRGRTGFPIVDAGMRELWNTGWMHNRVRMIVASFLVKDLRIPWQAGTAWFWDTLVDANLANNTLGWQWTAGCGADAAPYFRIFNPALQAAKFDPDAAYVKRWAPEYDGPTPPRAIVDHNVARDAALAAYDTIRSVH